MCNRSSQSRLLAPALIITGLIVCVYPSAAAAAWAEEADEPKVVYEVTYGSDIDTTHYVYDDQGHRIRTEKMYYPETDPYRTINYFYNEDGSLAHWEDDYGACSDFDEEGNLLYHQSTDGDYERYDELGRIAEEVDQQDGAAYYYAYTYEGDTDRLSRMDMYGADREGNPGEFLNYDLYEYDEDGRHYVRYSYQADGEKLGMEEEVRFDEWGNRIYQQERNTNTNWDKTESWSYDESGNLLWYQEGNGEYIKEERWYTYDAAGNLLQIERSYGSGVDNNTSLEDYIRDDEGKLIKVSLYEESTVQGWQAEYVKEYREYDERGNLSRIYTFDYPEYDMETNTFYPGQYETGGTADWNWKSMKAYIYDYDTDIYSKLMPMSEGE